MFHNQIVENVPIEPNDSHKPSVDFNIKGFLIEMRNKQDRPTMLDMESIHSKNNPIAMIIEENSPSNNDCQQQISSGTLNSSRKFTQMDAQGYQKGLGAVKPNIEFNKVLQKYKKLKLDEKRAPSPSVERMPATGAELKEQTKATMSNHKRVKSDVPQNPKKQLQI